MRWLNALLAFAPMHAGGLAAQALVLKQLDQLKQALDAAQLLVAAASENPETHNALGQVLQALGRFEPALAAYDRAASLPGTARETVLLNRATLFIEFVRTAQAQAALEAAAEAFPQSVAALFNQVDLPSFKADDPAIATMQALLAPGETQSRGDRMLLHLALGKVHLDLGNSERAFRHLDEGNRMKRATIVHDAAATARWMAHIPPVFTAALLDTKAGQGAMSPVPIFVLGMPRSGTTLMEQILASHPDIHGAGELRQMQTLVDGLESFPDTVRDLTLDRSAGLGEAYLAWSGRWRRAAGTWWTRCRPTSSTLA